MLWGVSIKAFGSKGCATSQRTRGDEEPLLLYGIRVHGRDGHFKWQGGVLSGRATRPLATFDWGGGGVLKRSLRAEGDVDDAKYA